MLDPEAVYRILPVPIQNLICCVEGHRIQRTRFGATFSDLLEQVQRGSQLTTAEIREVRDRRLREYIQQRAVHVPYYRRWFSDNDVAPGDIRTLEDLSALPIIGKQDVQASVSEFIPTTAPAPRRSWAHTSGTTGAGLRFPVTAHAVREQWAVWWRYRLWHGISPGTWCAYFGGRTVVPVGQERPPFWRYNVPGKQLLLSGFHMSPRNLPSYVDELRRRRPPWIHGYPSLVALLARHIVDSNVDIGYEIRWVTLGAENVLPHQIDVIQRAFQMKPRQHYGMAEAVANFSECELGNLHVDEDFAAVEFVPTGRDNEYRIVGCNLSNEATVLLRYDVGDLVEISDGECPCGLPGRLVAAVHGRDEDYVVLPNGALVGRLDHAFKDMVNVCESQLYQRSRSGIIVRVVKGRLYGRRDEHALLTAIRSRIGSAMDVKIEYVNSLERSPTGKLRFVVSDLPEGRL